MQASANANLTTEVVAAANALQLAPPVELTLANIEQNTWKLASQHQNRPLRREVWLDADGAVLQQVNFAQKPLVDRIVGVGIAAHEGALLGWVNLCLSLLTCAGLITLCISGFILWRTRKPDAVLGAPAAIPARLGKVVVAITLLLALFLPLMAISLCAILLLEFLMLRRVKTIRHWLGLAQKA
jgi:uncharacterized iron-regulated membrane protein